MSTETDLQFGQTTTVLEKLFQQAEVTDLFLWRKHHCLLKFPFSATDFCSIFTDKVKTYLISKISSPQGILNMQVVPRAEGMHMGHPF